MEQRELREWERRCIQEEPPECTAACPLHVDARALAALIRKGDWGAALAVLRKTMPLPDLLGRICDAPCEKQCKRQEAGEAIRIGLLERACVSRPAAQQRIVPLPRRNRRVAVIGSGLSSLTVAWDLCRKGCGLTLLEPHGRPGELLVQRFPQHLSLELVDQQILLMATLGLKVKTDQLLDIQSIEAWRSDFDALYIGLDGLALRPDAEPGRTLAFLTIDEKTRSTDRSGLFIGGNCASPVWQVAQGRWAATSIDRLLQNVSLTAGRDGEGPRSTRLHTNITGVTPLPAVTPADPGAGYSDPEARAEAERCLACECLECVKICPYLQKFGAYPRKYVREIYNNESIVMGARAANKLINSCSLCGLCERVCPEDFAMQTLCLDARRNMSSGGKMPPSAHEFALQDMAFSQSGHFCLARHAPGTIASAYLFFPGCQLCASAPQMVEAVYDYLRQHLAGGVGLMLDCCGAPAHWSGRQKEFDTARAAWRKRWEALGSPTLLVACSSCRLMFGQSQPPVAMQSLWEVLDGLPLPAGARAPADSLALHDPCSTRYAPKIQDAVRRLLSGRAASIEELSLTREFTECCGFGGLMQFANPGVAQTVVQRRAGLAPHDYVTYCAMCRDNLAASGKRCQHLLDLIFPEAAGDDPAGRPRPGWSRRRDNRAWLKVHLCETLWKEKNPEMEPHRRLKLIMAPGVADLMERRRILVEDVQRVIAQAERSGRKLRDPQSGRLKAGFKPVNVTFWVEYAPAEAGFIIFNVYAHRMEVT